ncbi:inner centromere protein [Tribolium madens]|uniref:inner centromere protein n=1 Tax=Tribolium madens TaxID=41895 RepID=UPI001CF756A0|nr:inner centromere protein [Tribolium madens]
MNAFEAIVNDLNQETLSFVEEGLKPIIEFNEIFRDLCKEVKEVVKEYKTTGKMPEYNHLIDFDKFKEFRESHLTNEEASGSSKENVEPDTDTETKKNARGRPRRNAFKEASQSISNLNEKLRRVSIKKEKMSIANSSKSLADEVRIKTENEEMPAPTRPAPKRRRKNATSKIIKQEKIEEELEKPRESDVIIKEVEVPIINLVDSLGEETTKTELEKSKRTRTSSDEGQENKEKRPKSNEDEKDNTNYEDAVSTLLVENTETNNATFIAASTHDVCVDNFNSTVVVTNPKIVNTLVPKTIDDLMTDDESEEETTKKNQWTKTGTIPKRPKQIFSPFEQSPVKKKVQAFEKLQEDADAIPVRITRTKTRNQAKEKELEEAQEQNQTELKSNVKEKAKMFTPLTSKFIPKAASTTGKSKKILNSSSCDNLLAKNSTTLKSSQAEYREIEIRRREKEQEALKKREAILQAQTEEKRRKREEKQLKAQQQREALEKEKQKVLEAQRVKDERHRLHIAEQEEKKLRLKEEHEKKRLLAKKRAIEQKKLEEEKMVEEERKAAELAAKLAKRDDVIAKMVQNQKERKPIYFRETAPPLPSNDCYDSDSEECKTRDILLQNWEKEANVIQMLKCISAEGQAIKNTFFSIQARTPDLQDILENIEPKKLKRTSSAVWHKPPRFTMIPGLESHDETEEFSDD